MTRSFLFEEYVLCFLFEEYVLGRVMDDKSGQHKSQFGIINMASEAERNSPVASIIPSKTLLFLYTVHTACFCRHVL